MNLPAQVNARDITIAELNELFDINFERGRMANRPWRLEQESLDVPRRLRKHSYFLCAMCAKLTGPIGGNLGDLRRAFYYESEASCRIAVDAMLVQCCLALRKKI